MNPSKFLKMLRTLFQIKKILSYEELLPNQDILLLF